MQDGITAKPLVDIFTDLAGEQVVMSGDAYVSLKTKEVLAQHILEEGSGIYESLLLASHKEKRITDISSECEADIVSGFASSALGTQHIYQSDRDDQTNLIGMVAGGTEDYFKCFDGTAWGYKMHTATQLKQVLNDGKSVKLSKLQTFAQKKASVEAVFVSQVQGDGGAADLNEAVSIIEAITWQS